MDALKALYQSVAAAAASFVAAFPSAAIVADLNVAKAAVVGAVAAAIGTAAGLVGSLLKQLFDRVRGYVGVGAEEAVLLLEEAQAKISEARHRLNV